MYGGCLLCPLYPLLLALILNAYRLSVYDRFSLIFDVFVWRYGENMDKAKSSFILEKGV